VSDQVSHPHNILYIYGFCPSDRTPRLRAYKWVVCRL
jgi:hypothetical protein